MTRKPCPNKEENLKEYPCCSRPTSEISDENLPGVKRSWPVCERKGTCCEFIAYHRERGKDLRV